jgi:hypothetical protein
MFFLSLVVYDQFPRLNWLESRNTVTVQGIAVNKDGEVGRVYLSVGGDSVDLLVGQVLGGVLFGRGHNRHGLSELLQFLGGRGDKHSQFAVAFLVLELAPYKIAVIAVGKVGELFEVLVNRDFLFYRRFVFLFLSCDSFLFQS